MGRTMTSYTPSAETVRALLAENSRHQGDYRYTVPSPLSYPYQWLWDSCFHAIMWNHFDPDRAAAELRTLIAKQHKSGLIGHVTYWKPAEILNVEWGTLETSSLIQPPLLAYALWRIYEGTDDVALLAEFYPALRAFYRYILRERDVRGVGLYGLVNPDESGEDNAPRFDAALNLPPQHDVKDNMDRRYELFHVHRECDFDATCTSRSFWVEDLSFNVYLYWNLGIMSDLAHVLGKPKECHFWQNTAERLKQAMREQMFNGEYFHSLSGHDGTPSTDDSWNKFLPLIAGLYTQSEAYTLVHEHLLDPERFWLPYGVPTVAATDPAYDPEEPTWGESWQHPDWRGAVWMVPHWCLYHGLTRYGFTNEAQEIRTKSCTLIERSGFRENFHPETGVGMGAEDFTWGGLIIDMN